MENSKNSFGKIFGKKSKEATTTGDQTIDHSEFTAEHGQSEILIDGKKVTVPPHIAINLRVAGKI